MGCGSEVVGDFCRSPPPDPSKERKQTTENMGPHTTTYQKEATMYIVNQSRLMGSSR